MIVVRVELWSAIDGSQTELARMVIDNTGGTAERGNYRVRTLRGRSREALNQALLSVVSRGGAPQREGQVLGHARLREHVWNLVAKALVATGYGEKRP